MAEEDKSNLKITSAVSELPVKSIFNSDVCNFSAIEKHMRNELNVIAPERNLTKMRIIFVCTFTCSLLFYFFMIKIDPANKDWLPGRLIISLLSVIAMLLTFSKEPYKWLRPSLNTIMISYMAVYSYLLLLNDWSVFHRWSYFVVVSIVVTAAVSWKDYIFLFLTGFICPLFFVLQYPLPLIELVHFFSTIIVAFFVIGIHMRLNFNYQKEVVKLTKTLIENSKMAALGEMAGSLAHEINNPLTILTLSNTQLDMFLQKDIWDEKKISLSLRRISEATNRIAHVVNGLRQFSQFQLTEKMEKIDLQVLFEETSCLFSEKLKAQNIMLSLERCPENGMCWGNKAEIGQVLLSLLNNAFDVCKKNAGPHEIKIRFVTTVESVKFSIFDSGPGVAKNIETDIFKPFFTTKPVGEGMGLGLSMSLGIARAHQGNLYLDRNISDSCFTLEIPRIINSEADFN